MKFFAVFIFCLPTIGICQAVRSPVSSSYIGFGAYSNHEIDVFSFERNEASLAKIDHPAAGLYGEKRFLLSELGSYDAAVAVTTSSGNFGIDLRYLGFSDYNENQIGLAYGRSLGNKADVGVQFNYYDVHISGYGNASTVNFETGIILHLTDNVNAGFHICNPVAAKFGKDEKEKLASVYAAGVGYEASENFFLSVETEKEENKPINVIAGMQYKFLSQLSARFGISSATSTIYFGIGFMWKEFRFDATASYQTLLGITPGMLVLFNFDKKEK